MDEENKKRDKKEREIIAIHLHSALNTKCHCVMDTC